ncbi:MAG: ABC transporter substrate-binding protein, partial [Hyphomicrobiales bacterium]
MFSSTKIIRGIGLCLVSLLALSLPMAASGQQTVTDARGNTTIIENPQHILSLGPDVTEIVYALGGGDRVIARDRSSRYPAEAGDKPDVGYRRTLSPEGLISLSPDLILASEDIGPPEAVDVLEGVSIPMV